MKHRTSGHRTAILSLGLPCLLAAFTGCGLAPSSSSPGVDPFNAGGVMQGRIHGGNQPISGATVQLYSVGTTGYGSAGTLYASTTTDNLGSGAFSFTQTAQSANTPGPTNPVSATYGCPASGDPQMYLLATGGDPGSGVNVNAASIVAIGPCSKVSSLFVNMNEVTTVATIAAMQQYFNPTADTLGSGSGAQSQLGLANAQTTIATLADISTGAARTTFVPTSAVAGVTVTATPEFSKINLMANILAACVNTAGAVAGGDNCSVLFANAIPQVNTLTSQPSATFKPATDTVQAAYYMFTNPTESQDNGPSGKLSKLFGLAAPAAPFAPAAATQPLDWTVGVQYSAGTTTCTSTGGRFFNPTLKSVAADASGNLWMNGGSSGSNSLVQMAPNGGPLACYGGTLDIGLGLVIDTSGNVYSGAAGSILEVPATGTPFTWTTTNLSGLTVDKNGNLFYVPNASATPIQEFVGASTKTAPTASISVGGNVTKGTYLYVAADASGRIFAPSSTNGSFLDLYPSTAAGNTNGYTLANIGAAPPQTNQFGAAIDSNGKVFGGTTCCAASSANVWYSLDVAAPATPGATPVTTVASSARFLGGLVGTRGVAVDGAGNVWAGMAYPVVDSTPANPDTYALGEVSNDLTVPISPTAPATPPTPCNSTNTDCPTGGGFQKLGLSTNVVSVAIDPSGNVWAPANSKSLLVEIVGQAVPVIAPIIAGPGIKP